MEEVNMTPLKVYNSLETESNSIKGNKVVDKELKQLILKMIREFKENTNKQLNELRKTIQDMKQQFNKETSRDVIEKTVQANKQPL
jgi:hypothetical protein